MPTPRISTRRKEQDAAPAAPAVVLAFPARARSGLQEAERTDASAGAGVLPAAPQSGERPTLVPPALREWLKATLIVSIAVHAIVFLAFQLRFEGDLERAAGAAAALSSEGTITIPVEVLVESMLPSAPSSTNASASDAAVPSTVPQETEVAGDAQLEPQLQLEDLLPPPPEPAPVALPTAQSLVQMPEPTEPAPVVLPTPGEAARLVLPEEQSAPPIPVETAKTSQGPTQAATTMMIEDKPPLPVARPPVAPKSQEKPQEQQAARSAPSAAASPSRAASANSKGSAGAGGALDAGGTAIVSSYFARIQAHLLRHRVYPPEARSSGITGVARVIFSLGRDGRVLSLSLAEGSGHSVLDQAALAMVRRAAPFPPIPSEIAASRLEMGAPIRFDLR